MSASHTPSDGLHDTATQVLKGGTPMASDAQLSLRITGLVSLSVKISASSSVASLKRCILDLPCLDAILPLPETRKTLEDQMMLTHGGEELQDELSLLASNVADGDLLVVDQYIHLNFTGSGVFGFQVAKSMTIEALKCAVEVWTGAPTSRQKLTFQGTELDDELCLWSYNVPHGSVVALDVLIRLRIVGIIQFAELFVDIWISSPVRNLKRLIKEETGIPVTNQKLLIRGLHMCDNNSAIQDYGAKNDDVVMLERYVSLPGWENTPSLVRVSTT
eukprot:TRINITY_DN18531_c0_g1_i1.p1 TRINITY_DN18531_c0_g1~~TRINITY_DN18531_c0_g1_i1.p1  ORF type:complete len:296 (+),score=46.62 TRINITY_DN18531_c0_g1_i1:65-889(+)